MCARGRRRARGRRDHAARCTGCATGRRTVAVRTGRRQPAHSTGDAAPGLDGRALSPRVVSASGAVRPRRSSRSWGKSFILVAARRASTTSWSWREGDARSRRSSPAARSGTTCPVVIIVTEAGGNFRDPRGRPAGSTSGGSRYSNGRIDDQLHAFLDGELCSPFAGSRRPTCQRNNWPTSVGCSLTRSKATSPPTTGTTCAAAPMSWSRTSGSWSRTSGSWSRTWRSCRAVLEVDGRPLRVGYVEAVAVAPPEAGSGHRHAGHGQRRRLHPHELRDGWTVDR